MSKVYLTFDIETDWGGRLPPVRENCKAIEFGLPWLIEVLDKFNIKGTFFISGEVVPLFSELFLELKKRGHELASHAYSHRLKFEDLSYEELKKDIEKAQESLVKLTGFEAAGFRIPQFRFNKHLHKVLRETGFKYDSSICQSRFSRCNERENSSHVFKEHAVTVWSPFKVPAGIMWIQKIGTGFFVKHCMSSKDDTIIYAHPFDWYEKSWNSNYSFKVNAWYLLSAHSKVKKSIKTIVERLHSENIKFDLLLNK